ncbi:YhbY family RNA-binding protein [Acetilactobacillus jinshanensis]|uniref:YhbY family RNA-binding protein n=1 Tax=Acetilactobacillus jinshanensis TaxID=1720083 RepID=A0A4P6ZM64_9LACO|nr:YhbY family RNA-binding protein [Acetilactobacillus jinshanensis]QBP18667.1 YhbY family RNA-binding protein [Acetilactobacillus jinshanensis]URL61543.1 YhbY family RNA-binding protein [uncultured bacterium]
MHLRGKQKRYLRARANQMRAIFSVGKQGMTQTWLNELIKALDKRELIKIKVLPNSGEDTSDVKKYIEGHSSIDVVQELGKTLVLFKPAKLAKYQKLSKIVANI